MSLNINSNRISNDEISSTIIQSETKGLNALQKFEIDWFHFTKDLSQEANLLKLRKLAVSGELKVSKFRSICWSILLGLLDDKSNEWPNQRTRQRHEYSQLRSIYSVNPHSDENMKDDPLSQKKQSAWNQHFCDQELSAVIKQDVVRTFPGVDFFRRPYIQNIMTSILFCYARKHPKMCYRQGMHEILAPIIFVIHSDHQVITHIKELNPCIDFVLQKLLHPDYLEEDSFTMFSCIMKSIESYYNVTNMVPTSTGYFPMSPGSPSSPQEQNRQSDIEIVNKLNTIRDKILAKEDYYLHKHLLNLDISLPIFGIRWLRLLFGREYPLQDLLILWDAIFAEGNDFGLTDFVVVAMLIKIRDRLLSSDYTTCLMHLMRYPNNVDVNFIIQHALFIKCPQKYISPQHALSYIPNETKSTTLSRPTQTKSKSQLTQNLKQESASTNRRRTQNEEYSFNSLQVASAQRTIKLANQGHRQEEEMPGVIEGYMENSTEALRLELHNAHTIMTISRIKLIQYLSVLRKYIPGHAMDELHQTLDGIEELCALLKTKPPTSYILPTQVDLAFEANEGCSSRLKNTPLLEVKMHSKNAQKADTETDYKLVEAEIYNSLHLNSSQPMVVESNEAEISARGTRYEIPDDKITRTAAKILGSRKELEMHDLHNFEGLAVEVAGDIPLIDPPGERSSPSNC